MSAQAIPPDEEWFPGLPARIESTVREAPIVQWASTTRAEVPIATPLLMFPNEESRTLDVTTGVAYPVKAERARRNPRVGIALGGADPSGLVVLSAYAAVRDAALQTNTDRYVRLFAPLLGPISGDAPWSVARAAVWYWVRIFIENSVHRVQWWPDGLDRPASIWEAPASFVAPRSDPAPSTPLTRAPDWPADHWSERAHEVVAGDVLPWLTLRDRDGFPLPFPIEAVRVTDEGFSFRIPTGHPWSDPAGDASIVWPGRATFVGRVARPTGSGRVDLRVVRLVADLPMARDADQTFDPAPATRRALLERLADELERRGQAMPTVSETPPDLSGRARSTVGNPEVTS